MRYKNLAGVITMSLGALIAPPTLADLNDGLVAYYPFDGNAQDASGNGHDGTVTGASLVDGVDGNGYKFDGKNDIIVVQNHSLIEEFPANGSITLSAWINLKGYAKPYHPDELDEVDGHMIIVAMDVGSSIQTRASLRIDDKGHFYYYSREHGLKERASYLVSKTPIPLNEWHHVVAVHQGSKAKLYLDGKLVARDSSFTPLMAPWRATSASIGGWTDWWGVEESTFNGTIDEVSLYNRVLSECEIKTLYTGKEKCNPNLVTLNSFTATPYQNYIRIDWETASEVDNAGFDIWRATGEGWKEGDYSQVIKLTEQLISSKASKVGGASYSYTDNKVESGVIYYYGLVDIDYHGQYTLHLTDEVIAK